MRIRTIAPPLMTMAAPDAMFESMFEREVYLLTAIQEGRMVQYGKSVQGRWYQIGAEIVTYHELRRMVEPYWIRLPLTGPPTLLEDGISWLRAQQKPA